MEILKTLRQKSPDKAENKKIIIATHSSVFHTDDVFATATLILWLKKEKEIGLEKIEIVRTRNQNKIEEADYVVDVGKVYDPENNRFDHHQETIKRENNIPYAAFGLVWKHFGIDLCNGNKKVWQKIEEKLAEPIDSHDTGYLLNEPGREYILEDVVETFLPSWKEEKDFDSNFLEAVNLAKKIISREIKKSHDELEAKEIVREIYRKSKDKRILVLDQNYPLDDLAYTEMPDLLYKIFPVNEESRWYLKAIKAHPGRFDLRKPLPKEWAQKSREEMKEITGVDDVFFVHNNLFVAVTDSKEGALKLAEIAICS